MAGGGGDADGARFADMLRHLRGLASSCEPPIGVGSFDVLYASDAEVVVWYAPVREHQQPAEVVIPAARLAAAWRALMRGETLDEAALEAHGGGPALGRWLLALLVQLPGVRVCPEPLALDWSPPVAVPKVPVAVPAVSSPAPAPAPLPPRRRRARAARPG
jgi:hypothetical protein